MTIARIIEGRSGSQVISCDSNATMREAVALLADKRIGAVPVMRGGSVVGIFSERDVIYKLAHEGEVCLEEETIEEVMDILAAEFDTCLFWTMAPWSHLFQLAIW